MNQTEAAVIDSFEKIYWWRLAIELAGSKIAR
jgi:hypothetical protein